MLARLKSRLAGNSKKDGDSVGSAVSPDSAASHHVVQPGSHQRYLQTLKEYSLLLEFKKLRDYCPSGVYILPSSDSLRRWHGVIFLRKGFYRKGIFKFLLHIPTSYPDEGPRVQFISDVFHPLINPNSGDLDSSIEFPRWDASQHFIVLLLCYIKKIFFKTEYWEPRPSSEGFNKAAAQLWMKNKEEFLKRCEKCCNQSIDRVFVIEEGSPLKFMKPIPVHEAAWNRIMETEEDKGESSDAALPPMTPSTKLKRKTNYSEWFQNGIQRLNEGVPAPGLVSPYLERNSALLPENLPLVTPATLPHNHPGAATAGLVTPKKMPDKEKDKSSFGSSIGALFSSSKTNPSSSASHPHSHPHSTPATAKDSSSHTESVLPIASPLASPRANSSVSSTANSSNSTSTPAPASTSASVDLLNLAAIPDL